MWKHPLVNRVTHWQAGQFSNQVADPPSQEKNIKSKKNQHSDRFRLKKSMNSKIRWVKIAKPLMTPGAAADPNQGSQAPIPVHSPERDRVP